MKKLILFSISIAISMLFLRLTSSAQTTVVVPGNFQNEIGCPGDWMPDCDLTRLTETTPGIWEGTFYIYAGNWSYKIAYDNSWNENYGEGGVRDGVDIPLILTTPAYVHFSFSSETHLVVATQLSSPIKVSGNFLDELGCSSDWVPDCDATGLAYDDLSNTWFGMLAIPPGSWEFKIVHDNSWDENYGEGGVLNGEPIPLVITDDRQILFQYDPSTHFTTTTPVDPMVSLIGDFQNELGCEADWSASCALTAMMFDGRTNRWVRKLTLAPGSWMFKVALDSSGTVNYGVGGVQNGENYSLSVSDPSVVSFTYNPESHQTIWIIEPVIVTLPGSFQSLLGCAGDWDPGCNVTQLTFNPATYQYSGTFDLPAGYYEYKVAINSSWEENYGLDGIFHGPNIPLYLEGDANITFLYDPFSHYVTLQFNSSSLCVTAFYDANANQYNDEYLPMEGILLVLEGDSIRHEETTDASGVACFSNLIPMPYLLKTEKPQFYKMTTAEELYVYPYGPSTTQVGMVCLGEAGAKERGFWTSRNGKRIFTNTAYNEYILTYLSYLNLRNPNGSLFVPASYDQLALWMKEASGRNMSNLASAELAALVLNQQTNLVDPGRMIYTPGIGYYGNGDFMDGYSLVWLAGSYLSAYPVSKPNDSSREIMEKLKNILERANGDKSFVQHQPCSRPECSEREYVRNDWSDKAKLWPNPSHTCFFVKVPFSEADGPITIRVFDRYNTLVCSSNGQASEEFRFGDDLPSGMYFVRIEQGNQRIDVKAIKK